MATNKISNQEVLAALEEVNAEIIRINRAAGHTVFNPAATDLVRDLLAKLGA